MRLRLYNFFRSGTSHRLRIALNLKGLAYDYVPVDLRRGEHEASAFREINPQGLVPALEVDGRYTQTPAILEWLEEVVREPPLLPRDPEARAYVRTIAAIVGCDIHPVNNRRILETLRHEYGADQGRIDAWAARWIAA
ncbi:MAG: glutathione S-transferase N-terminal domain-containing protein, partial [Casimicrobiaceae bacterium]|nr:glutathione S-transferase N-terminal domain-containing protein [Casimicrobiaceae bacterium]